jgi:hypothetical protein
MAETELLTEFLGLGLFGSVLRFGLILPTPILRNPIKKFFKLYLIYFHHVYTSLNINLDTHVKLKSI